MTSSEKITCQICGALDHAIQLHLKKEHPDWDINRYKMAYPSAPLLSEKAKATIKAQAAAKLAKTKTEPEATGSVVTLKTGAPTRQAMHELFGFGTAKAAMNARGEPIMVTVFGPGDHDDLVPTVDPNFVYDIENTKTILMGLEVGMPIYAWGLHGTGKTSGFRNIVGATRRPWVRVQHTINTEESHIVGQMLANESGTYFEPGPLALAMKHGWVYCADEYDFAMPAVLAVYQPVLEGEPLYIKEAPPEWRSIKPHPNFRFVATGNTNGAGDETGLYQGTQLGNAANFSRFSITIEVGYMAPKVEAAVIAGQAGIDLKDAEKLVHFATEIRTAYTGQRIGAIISPRELIAAARIGLMRGSDWRKGLQQAFTNRLSRVDKETAEQVAQRLFG